MKKIESIRRYFCEIEMLWKYEIVIIITGEKETDLKLGDCDIKQK